MRLGRPSVRWGLVGCVLGIAAGLTLEFLTGRFSMQSDVRVLTNEYVPLERQTLRFSARTSSLGESLELVLHDSRDNVLQRIAEEQLKASDLQGTLETGRLIQKDSIRKTLMASILVEGLRQEPLKEVLARLPAESLSLLDADAFSSAVRVLLEHDATVTPEIISRAQALTERLTDPLAKAEALRIVAVAQNLKLKRPDLARRTLLKAKEIAGAAESQASHPQGNGTTFERTKPTVTQQPSPQTSARASADYDWKPLLWAAGLGTVGFLVAAMLKPVLEALGRVFVGRALAELIRHEELAIALGAAPRTVAPSTTKADTVSTNDSPPTRET